LSNTSGDPYSHTSTCSLPAGSKLGNLRLKSPIKRKKGGHFWWPPLFLKPDCYSKTVRSLLAHHN